MSAGVVVAFQANQLPNPLVEISVPGQPVYQVAAKHSLKPHFPTEHPARFERITQDAAVTVRLYDDKAGRRNQLLGEAVLPCKQIKVTRGLRCHLTTACLSLWSRCLKCVGYLPCQSYGLLQSLQASCTERYLLDIRLSVPMPDLGRKREICKPDSAARTILDRGRNDNSCAGADLRRLRAQQKESFKTPYLTLRLTCAG